MTLNWPWMNHIIDIPIDRVCESTVDSGGMTWFFNDEFMTWLRSHRELFENLMPRHKIFNRQARFFFERSDQATLFKLRWGGQ